MSFSEWKVITFQESGLEIEDGDRGKNYPNKSQLLREGYCPFLNNKNIAGDKLNFEETDFITKEKDQLLRKGKAYRGDIILTTRGSVGNVALFDETIGYEFIRINSGMVIIRNNDLFDLKFLYQQLKSPYMKTQYKNMSTGSAQPQLPIRDIRKLELLLPPLQEQKSIAHILSTLDDKIEVNNQINKTLENMAQTIFKQWFVDFEFPNEDGEPYKSSGGEMVESELGMIPKGWEVKDLGEIIDIHDSKRIPLSKNEREKREKIYPYYGAASLMDYVDEFIFDGIYVLLGEDGTVVNEDGSPVLQYVWGKFWVNNHAHVLSGKKGVSTNFLYILLSNLNVSGAITGAVQLKINQKNLKEMNIIMPNDMKLVSQFSDIVDKSFEKIRVKRDENNNLVSLRDSLLPKLMSGEIRVPLDSEGDAS